MAVNRVRLTDKFISALRPTGSHAVDYPDEITPGLVLRVTPAGVKSWSFRYRNADGRPTRKALKKRYPDMGLAEARSEAKSLRDMIADGVDIAAPRRPDGATFKTVVDRWERRQKGLGKRSAPETRRIIDLHVTPHIGDRYIDTIRRRDVVEILERLRDESGFGAQVNRVHRAISGVLSYAVDADLIEVNPIAGLKPQVKERERVRALSLDEVAAVWDAAETLGPLGQSLVRLLILTGQRREEVTGVSWSELDFNRSKREWTSGGLWTIPAARSKSKRDHVIPLGAAARAIIETRPQGAEGDFVFSATDGATSFAGWRRAASTLATNVALDQSWTIHDLRRSFATGIGEVLNAEESIIGRILGHSARSRMGVTARYERSGRLDAMRETLDAWAQAVAASVAARKGDNVIPFATERARG